jgi:hypothetical protein
MGDKFQMPEEATEVTKARHSKMNKVLATLLGLFGVVGPVVSAYIGYRQSKVEAAAEIAKAHKESEAGYQAVSSPLSQILPIVVQMSADLAQVKAEVAFLRGSQTLNVPMAPNPPLQLRPMSGGLGAIGTGAGTGSSSSITSSSIMRKPDESPAALRPLLRPLPKSLREAAEQQVEAQ